MLRFCHKLAYSPVVFNAIHICVVECFIRLVNNIYVLQYTFSFSKLRYMYYPEKYLKRRKDFILTYNFRTLSPLCQIYCLGSEGKDIVMAAGIYGKGCSPHGGQEAGKACQWNRASLLHSLLFHLDLKPMGSAHIQDSFLPLVIQLWRKRSQIYPKYDLPIS